jgi:hypothetical protein
MLKSNIYAFSFLLRFLLAYSNDEYLTHYWPICNGQMKDEIGGSHMMQGGFTSFTSDRFGNLNSSLALNGGWTQVPSGIYFDTTEFTISAWIYPKNVGLYSRLIDFGNGENMDNVLFSIDSSLIAANLKPSVLIVSSTSYKHVFSSEPLKINEWQHLSATFNGITINIYINGTLTLSSGFNGQMPKTLNRTKCYIGKSNWELDGNSSSIVDDLRFYNKSLSQIEIIELMNINETGFNYLFIV